MIMRQIKDDQYKLFTPKERLNLTLAALSRGDKIEAERLWRTCPRQKYMAQDFEFTLSLNAIILLSSLFFEQCVKHYNLIQKIELMILDYEQDLESEEKDTHRDCLAHARKCTDYVNLLKLKQISKLKGLFEGFRLFCFDNNLDCEDILETIPLKDCCHDLDKLLSKDVQIDLKETIEIKNFFTQHWHL